MIGGCSVYLPAGLGGWVNLGTVAARDFTSSPFTLASWVFPTLISGWHVLQSNGSSGLGGYDLLTSSSFTQPNLLRLRTHSPATAWTESNKPLVVNRWQHVAAVRDGASARIYIDGEDCTGIAGVHSDPVPWGSNSAVGANPLGAATFNGAIDEPAWFNRALTQAEIRRLMYAQLTGSESGLVSYHRFDDGRANYASTTATAVVSGVNGTLAGAATWVFDRWAPWIEPRVHSTADAVVGTGPTEIVGTRRAFIFRVQTRLQVVASYDLALTGAGSGTCVCGDVNGSINQVVWTPGASASVGSRATLSGVWTFDVPPSAVFNYALAAYRAGTGTFSIYTGHTGYAIVAMPKYGTW